MDYTILRYQANHPYLFFLSTTFLKKKFGFIIIGLNIYCLELLRSCFLLCLGNQMLRVFHCEICELAKHKCSTFSINNKRSSEPFYLIHSDIQGPSPVPNIFGARQFVFFIDDYTRVSWIFILKYKFDVSFVLPNFHYMIKNQFGFTIKRFQSNNASDYFNQFLTPYFHHEGIIHELSCVNTLLREKMVTSLIQHKFFYSKNMCLYLIRGQHKLITFQGLRFQKSHGNTLIILS